MAEAGLKAATVSVALMLAAPLDAGQVDVLDVVVRPTAEVGVYDFAVTLRHADSGWDHYANRWELVGPDGSVIATRVLAHPHVHEQPFTRTLGNVRVPSNLTWVKVRGHDLVHGYGGREATAGLPSK